MSFDNESSESPYTGLLLRDNCDTQYGYTQSASDEEVGPKFLRITDIQSDIIDWKDVPYCEISDKDVEKYKLKPGDIVVARTGASTGSNAIYIESMPDAVFASYLIRIKANDKFVPEFLYYFLQSNEYRNYIRSIIGGSAQPNANAKQLTRVKVPCPPTRAQKKIAGILRSLDKKIEINYHINQLLEETVKAIFKSWFVDHEPFADFTYNENMDKKIPKGWEVESLDKIANFLNGKACQNYEPRNEETDTLPVVKITELREGIKEDSDRVRTDDVPEKYIIGDGDVIFSWSASLLLKLWTGGRAFLNQHLFKVTSEESVEYPKWFYYLWTSRHLRKFRHIAAAKATTMGHIKRKDLDDALVLVPDKGTLDEMTTIIAPLFERRIINGIESRALASLRETLLPRLMSGEIRVVD